MAATPLSVFISHTAEFVSTYSGRSFVAAAQSAVTRLGHRVVEMATFGASVDTPRDKSVAALAECDVVVALIGFRFGSQVPDGSHRSYVQYELDAADERGIPRLIFLLSDTATVPIGVFFDAGPDAGRQAEFRARLLDGAGTADHFTSPDDLETRVMYALSEFQSAGGGRAREVVESAPLFTPPPLDPDFVARPELMTPLLAALERAEANSTVGIVAALRGAGGFGKTTLALAACHDEGVRRRFSDGVLWVTLGEQLDAAALAAVINDLSELLSGRRPSLTMPEQAGQHFAQVLGRRRVLLVLDDVWRTAQLSPFMYAGASCVRLLTTRNQALIPAKAATVMVDSMKSDQAQELLTQNLGEVPAQEWLLHYTAGWPVLISLVNALLRRYRATGRDLATAVRRAQAALAYAGPTAFDLANPQARTEAISLTVEASLAELGRGPGGDRRLARFLSLAVFREDESVPIEIVAMMWAGAAEAVPPRPTEVEILTAERFCLELLDLSLLQDYRPAEGRLTLHDVMHKFLVHKAGDDLPRMHRDLVELARGRFGVMESNWSLLPIEAAYLWLRLPWHLARAGDGQAELDALVCDLRWVVRKTFHYGLATVDADLALAATGPAARLRRVLNQCAHLLEPLETEESIAALMLARLAEPAGIEAVVEPYAAFAPPRLTPVWPLPDQPHPALLRVLPGHVGSVSAVAVIEHRSLVASAGGFDGTVHLWDLHTSELRRSFTGHTERVNSICAAPDESWIACGDGDISGCGTIHVWDVETGDTRAVLEGVSERVNVVVALPDGRLLASGDGDIGGGGSVRVWDIERGEVVRHLSGHLSMVTGLAVSADGAWLASAGGFDNAVWLWELADPHPSPRLLRGHTSQITSLAFAPDGSWLASAGGLDGTVRVWRPGAEQPRVLWSGDAEVWSLTATPDGAHLAAGRGDGSVDIWHVASGELRACFVGGRHAVNAVVMAAEKWLVAAEEGGMIRVWDTDTAERPATLIGHGRATASVTAIGPAALPVSVDPQAGGKIVTGDSRHPSGSRVRVWNSRTGVVEAELPGHAMSVTAILSEVAEGCVLTAGADGWVRAWRLADGVEEYALSGHDGGIWALAGIRGTPPESDGWLATAGGFDGKVHLWSPAAGGHLQTFTGHEGGVWALGAASDGTRLFTGAGNGDLRCFRRAEPAAPMTPSWRTRLPGGIEKIAVCDQGAAWLAVGTDDGEVHIVDAPTGEVSASWKAHRGRLRGLDVSSAEQYLATVGEDRIVRVWRVQDYSAVTALRIGGIPNECTWLPNELRLCVVGDDGIHMLELIDGVDAPVVSREPAPHLRIHGTETA